jgi:hypothetical protein
LLHGDADPRLGLRCAWLQSRHACVRVCAMHSLVACLHRRARGLDRWFSSKCIGRPLPRNFSRGNFSCGNFSCGNFSCGNFSCGNFSCGNVCKPSVRPKVQFRFRSIFAETSRVVTCHSSFPPVSEWAMPCLHRFPSRQPGFVLSAAQIFLQGIIGVEMLSGKLRNRCVYTEGTLWSTALQPTNRTASYCRRCLCMCARVPSRPRPSLLLVRVRVQDQTTGCLPSRPT